MPREKKCTRAKSGCFTCRARRKKCDEHTPVCLACERNNLDCNWPSFENQTLKDYQNHTIRHISRKTSESIKSVGISDTEVLGISAQEKLSLDFILGFFLGFICPTPAADHMKELIKNQILRDEVFRKVSVCIWNHFNPSLGGHGRRRFLNDAINSLRGQVSLPHRSHDIDFLQSISFLNLLEMMQSNPNVSNVIMHMQAIFEIICSIVSSGANLNCPMFRSCADSYFYNYGILLLISSEEQSRSLPGVFNLLSIWKSFLNFGDNDYDSNPMLGNTFKSISYMNRACYIFRCTLFEKKTLAILLTSEIEESIRRKDTSLHQRFLMVSAKILVLQIADPKENYLYSQIKQYIEECLTFLSNLETKEEDFTIFWVYLICGLCIEEEDEKSRFRTICSGESRHVIHAFEIPLLEIIEISWTRAEGLRILHDAQFRKDLRGILSIS